MKGTGSGFHIARIVRSIGEAAKDSAMLCRAHLGQAPHIAPIG